MRLAGKTALITGAGKGIGRAGGYRRHRPGGGARRRSAGWHQTSRRIRWERRWSLTEGISPADEPVPERKVYRTK